MSDLAATNCSCSNTDNGCGCSSILWIILLLCCCCGMVTEALSSEETTVETAITAVSGLSSYFSAVVALAVEAAIMAADVAAAADLHFYCGSFRPAAFYDFSVFFFCLRCSFSLSFSRTLHSPFTLCFLMHSSSISYTS